MKRMDGYSGGLIDQYTKAIADARNVDLSIGDQLIVAKAMAQVCEMEISKSAYLLLMKIPSWIVVCFGSSIS